jgi:hypothetical protein
MPRRQAFRFIFFPLDNVATSNIENAAFGKFPITDNDVLARIFLRQKIFS